MGGYVGSLAVLNRWVEPMVAQWMDTVGVLTKIVSKYPQCAYHDFATSLQTEWLYLYPCIFGVGQHPTPLEEAIRKQLIPALLQLLPGLVSEDLRTLLSHRVKFGGMNICNPKERGQPLRGMQGCRGCPGGVPA